MIQLTAKNLHYLGDTEPSKQRDCCVHGDVLFSINDTVIENGGEWCVSASALRLMRSVFANHFSGEEEHMIPCCGHYMIPADDGKSVQISGCTSGVDFDVVHENNQIMIKTENGQSFQIEYSDYKDAVISYSDQIEKFMHDSPPRIFDDSFDEAGYNAFKTEWFYLKYKLAAPNNSECTAERINFSDFISISDSDILGVSENGISLKTGQFINFKECAYTYFKLNGGNGRCIGEHDTESLSFTFYTAPLPTDIQFIKRNILLELARNTAHNRFCKLQKSINSYGYTTIDIS